MVPGAFWCRVPRCLVRRARVLGANLLTHGVVMTPANCLKRANPPYPSVVAAPLWSRDAVSSRLSLQLLGGPDGLMARFAVWSSSERPRRRGDDSRSRERNPSHILQTGGFRHGRSTQRLLKCWQVRSQPNPSIAI